jgi:peptidoglycan-associated lipoprotein
MRHHFAAVSLGLLSAISTGCSSAPPPEAKTPEAEPAPEPAPAPAENTQKPGDNPAQSDINISDEIKTACGLTETEAHFGYNSANVRDADSTIMKKLADCFTTGKLKGRTMRLVGHADPRGEPEYNMVLGGRRADNVALAVKKAGLPAAQVTTTSRGELEARGTDEASWAKDRRVDIHLAEAE